MELKIDESKVKECLKECPEFKKYALILWPELERGKDVTRECTLDASFDSLHIIHNEKYIGYVTDMCFTTGAPKGYGFEIPPNLCALHVYKR